MKVILKKEKGITLIALVVTIVVLLILAGVSIAMLTGENGLIARAIEARKRNTEASVREQVQLEVQASKGIDGNINLDDLNNGLSNIDDLKYNGNPISAENKIEKLPAIIIVDGYKLGILGNGEIVLADSIEDIENIQNTVYVAQKTIVQDVNDNNFVLPEGFKIRVDESTNNADSIEKGIVIEDNEKNQYVWIPVDGILGENGTIDDVTGSEKKILLGRYSFDLSGTPSDNGSTNFIEETQKEHETSGYGNTIAKDIEEFIDSVRENGGYYLARFEASQNTVTNKVESKYDKTVWTNMTQSVAATACQDLYTGVNSDLINSYAWDTAILFIQKNGKTDYSIEIGKSTTNSKANTGKNILSSTGKEDLQLNIYDMAGNCREWSTETSTIDQNQCVSRGGVYNVNVSKTTDRRDAEISDSYDSHSFRLLLYL